MTAFEMWRGRGAEKKKFELIDGSPYGNPSCAEFYDERSCPFEMPPWNFVLLERSDAAARASVSTASGVKRNN
jgi:hypothetical protein